MSVSRNAFKLFVSIDGHLDPSSDIMKRHTGFPIDNVIQIKMNKDSFVGLFKDTVLASGTSASDRYNSASLLTRLGNFFDRSKYSNHNNLASDITILINNTYNDVDVNPVTLETACAKDGSIFNYFVKSKASWDSDNNNETTSTSIDQVDASYGDATTSGGLMVYEVIGQEIDNMISRNYLSTSEDNSSAPDNSYDDLDDLYTRQSDQFWTQSKVGDSIFIEGSFNVPTARDTPAFSSLDRDSSSYSYDPVGSGNLPVILQFVHADVNSYSYNPAT
jgi:hypothetical protein